MLTSGDHGGEREAAPVPSVGRQRQERGQQGQDPEFADEAVPGAVAKVLAALGQREHEDDLQRRGGDGKHVAVEGREADSLEGQ